MKNNLLIISRNLITVEVSHNSSEFSLFWWTQWYLCSCQLCFYNCQSFFYSYKSQILKHVEQNKNEEIKAIAVLVWSCFFLREGYFIICPYVLHLTFICTVFYHMSFQFVRLFKLYRYKNLLYKCHTLHLH